MYQIRNDLSNREAGQVGSLAGFGSFTGGAAPADWGAGGAIGADGDPGETAEGLIAFGAGCVGAEVAGAVELDVAGDEFRLLVVVSQEGDACGQQGGQREAGRLRQVVVCLLCFRGDGG